MIVTAEGHVALLSAKIEQQKNVIAHIVQTLECCVEQF